MRSRLVLVLSSVLVLILGLMMIVFIFKDPQPDVKGESVIRINALAELGLFEKLDEDRYIVQYDYKIENNTDKPVYALTSTNNLKETFGTTDYKITSFFAEGVELNHGFDGDKQTNFLGPGNILGSGALAEIFMTIEFRTKDNFGTYENYYTIKGLQDGPSKQLDKKLGDSTNVKTNEDIGVNEPDFSSHEERIAYYEKYYIEVSPGVYYLPEINNGPNPIPLSEEQKKDILAKARERWDAWREIIDETVNSGKQKSDEQETVSNEVAAGSGVSFVLDFDQLEQIAQVPKFTGSDVNTTDDVPVMDDDTIQTVAEGDINGPGLYRVDDGVEVDNEAEALVATGFNLMNNVTIGILLVLVSLINLFAEISVKYLRFS